MCTHRPTFTFDSWNQMHSALWKTWYIVLIFLILPGSLCHWPTGSDWCFGMLEESPKHVRDSIIIFREIHVGVIGCLRIYKRLRQRYLLNLLEKKKAWALSLMYLQMNEYNTLWSFPDKHLLNKYLLTQYKENT